MSTSRRERQESVNDAQFQEGNREESVDDAQFQEGNREGAAGKCKTMHSFKRGTARKERCRVSRGEPRATNGENFKQRQESVDDAQFQVGNREAPTESTLSRSRKV